MIVGLIHRAHRVGTATSPAAVVLDAAQLGTVLGALADAAKYRRKEAGHWWADCQASPVEARRPTSTTSTRPRRMKGWHSGSARLPMRERWRAVPGRRRL